MLFSYSGCCECYIVLWCKTVGLKCSDVSEKLALMIKIKDRLYRFLQNFDVFIYPKKRFRIPEDSFFVCCLTTLFIARLLSSAAVMPNSSDFWVIKLRDVLWKRRFGSTSRFHFESLRLEIGSSETSVESHLTPPYKPEDGKIQAPVTLFQPHIPHSRVWDWKSTF